MYEKGMEKSVNAEVEKHTLRSLVLLVLWATCGFLLLGRNT